MSKSYFFQDLNFENYRGIQKLSIPNLKRVNLIGGLNGVGKTTILDGIFSFLGRGHPLALSRPFMVRNSKLPYPNGFDYLYYNYNPSNVAKIYGRARTGDFSVYFQSAYVSNVQINSQNLPNIALDLSTLPDGASRSVVLKVSTDDNKLTDEIVFSQPSEDNVGYHVKQGNIAKTPPAAYTSSATFNASEDAQRFSILLKERRVERLYEYLRFMYSDLKALQLLQEGGLPVLYAEFSDLSLSQVVLLGGGFQMMLSVCLLMMTTKDAIFLFDEIDNTIHHSLLNQFWSLVSKLASETNGQVFAVTHSRECIGAAVKGFQKENNLADLAYYRLEEGVNRVECVSYDGQELIDALSSDWEMR